MLIIAKWYSQITKNILYLLCLLSFCIISFNCAGCPYSFTGAAVDPHLKTIGIGLFDDNSNYGEVGFREMVTKTVVDKFINDNTLKVADRKNSDAVLEAVITRVTDNPATLAAGETVNKRRIEIAIRVTYTDMVKRKKIYEKEFSNWGDYVASSTGFAQRQEGLKIAIDKIAEDILLQTVSGW
jgi:hypothetical protein